MRVALVIFLLVILLRHFLLWKGLQQIFRQLQGIRASGRTNQLVIGSGD